MFWNGVAAVLSRGLPVLGMMLAARILGREHFGQLGIAHSTAMMLQVFAVAGLGIEMTTGNREDFRKRFVVEITRVPGADFEALKEALRHADTATMTTPQVVDFCKARVPGCTIEEIVRALQQVGDKQLQEADRLSRDSSDAGS